MTGLEDFAPLELLLAGAGVFCIACAFLWLLCFKIKFRVTPSHVEVVVLKWAVRRVALDDIEFADRRWCWWNEHYNTTLNPKRIVRLRRRTGIVRNFIITPRSPVEFLADLEARGVAVR